MTRAKRPEAKRRAQRQAAAARQGVRQIETREAFRAALSERDRSVFGALPIKQQQRFIAAVRQYPEQIAPSEPDPFSERPFYRGSLWRLYYATRAGIRRRAA